MKLEEVTMNAMLTLALDKISIENSSDGHFCYQLFIKIFGRVPYVLNFYEDELDEREIFEVDDASLVLIDDYDDNCCIDMDKTETNIIKKFDCYVHRWRSNRLIVTENFIVYRGSVYSMIPHLSDEFKECIVNEDKEIANFKYVSIDNRGDYNIQLFPIKDVEVSIEDNYNDDIPYEDMEKYLQAKDSALLLLYGIPGTGKTHVIRKLIRENPNITFYWLDSSMFSQINSTAFINFLFKCKNSIFILEDCESVLKDRTTNYNSLITPILNISDGMLGDVLNIKFICTFNTDLDNIDGALLRKGRLKLKYEFKELKKDKVQNLYNKLNINKIATKDLPLCDIFNQDDNGVQERKSIGFGV